MPAVQLSRLKDQIRQLAWHFTRPVEFQKHLQELLDLYADRTYRAGQAVNARPLIPVYHVAPLVVRQLQQDLAVLCQENPGATLALVDVLWRDDYLEPRLLAASLLGQIPLTPPEEVLKRLLAWSQPDVDLQLLEALLKEGSLRLRREQVERWLVLIEHWLSDRNAEMQVIGLKALLPMIQDRGFENLPRIFRLLGPLIQTAPNTLQLELVQDVNAIAHRSPAETVYFLRQMMNVSSSPMTVRLIRRCLPAFPEELQASLRSALVTRAGSRRG